MTLAGAGSDKVPNINMHKDCRVFNDITEAGQMDVTVAYTDRMNMAAALERTLSRPKMSESSMHLVYILHVQCMCTCIFSFKTFHMKSIFQFQIIRNFT